MKRKYIPILEEGGFSDNFYSTLSKYMELQNQQKQQQDYYTEPQDEQEQIQDQPNEWEEKYSALEEELNNLKQQISSFQPQEQEQSSPFNQYDNGSMDMINMVLNDDEEVKQTNSNQVVAKATTYGYSDDQYGDRYSLEGIGHRNNKLIAGQSVAISKETAQRIGAQKGDRLKITLPNGEIKTVKYDDTVPSIYNEDRVDFYDPSKNVNFDGKKVIIEKYEFGGKYIPIFEDGGEVDDEEYYVDQPPKRKPIITNNPNDPRLKAYNDSLRVFNSSNDLINYVESDKRQDTDPKVNKKIEFAKNISPIGQKNDYVYYDNYKNDILIPVYKKPVQPVVYQKEKDLPKGKTVSTPLQDLHQGQTNNFIDRELTPLQLDQPQTYQKQSGQPIYHSNNDLLGYMNNGEFEKINNTEGLKSDTKHFLQNDQDIDSYLKSKLGDYYKGQKKMKFGGKNKYTV